MTQSTPDLIGDGAKAIVDQAKRLGLTWDLRPATVTSVVNGVVEAVYDGDTEPIGMVSLVGALTTGDRVMVLEVPPSGNFIISLLTTTTAPVFNRGTIDGVQVTSGTIAGAITVETDMPELALSGVFQKGRAYAIDVQIRVTESATADDWLLRVRLDTPVSGTEIGQAAFSGFNIIGQVRATFIYVPTSSGPHNIYFSVGPSGAVTGNLTVFGSSLPLNRTYASVSDAGSTSVWREA